MGQCNKSSSPAIFVVQASLRTGEDLKHYSVNILLGILETSFKGLNTRKDLNILRSTSTFDSANMVIDLKHHRWQNWLSFQPLQYNTAILHTSLLRLHIKIFVSTYPVTTTKKSIMFQMFLRYEPRWSTKPRAKILRDASTQKIPRKYASVCS